LDPKQALFTTSLPHTVYHYFLNSSVDALEVLTKMSPWNTYPLLSNGNVYYPDCFPCRYCTLNKYLKENTAQEEMKK